MHELSAGGTLVDDGTDDVKSTDGSVLGPSNTSSLTELGIAIATLESDLDQLVINGLITDPNPTDTLHPAETAEIQVLRIIGLLSPLPPTPCTTCATLDDVRIGASLWRPQ